MENKKKAQAWVETAVYTLIGLAIIGIILVVANPAIEKYKDRTVIEQTITALDDLNNEILEVKDRGAANKRIVQFNLKKGNLIVDGEEEKIYYILEESRLEYSETGEEISQGDIKIKTERRGRKYDITLSLVYGNIGLTYNDNNVKKTFTPAPSPHNLAIENLGVQGEKILVDIKES